MTDLWQIFIHEPSHSRRQMLHHQHRRRIGSLNLRARSPNRFFIEIRLSMKWTVVSKDIVDVGGSNFVGRSVATKHWKMLAEMLRMSGRGVWIELGEQKDEEDGEEHQEDPEEDDEDEKDEDEEDEGVRGMRKMGRMRMRMRMRRSVRRIRGWGWDGGCRGIWISLAGWLAKRGPARIWAKSDGFMMTL